MSMPPSVEETLKEKIALYQRQLDQEVRSQERNLQEIDELREAVGNSTLLIAKINEALAEHREALRNSVILVTQIPER